MQRHRSALPATYSTRIAPARTALAIKPLPNESPPPQRLHPLRGRPGRCRRRPPRRGARKLRGNRR